MSTSQTSPRITATLSNLTLLGAGEILTRALTFVAFAYLGRVLEPSSFGLVGSVLAVMMLGTLLVDQGLGTIGARDVAMDISVAPTTIDRVVSAQLLLAIGVVCLVFLGSWLVPADPTLLSLLRWYALTLLGVPFLLSWLFQGRNEMSWYAGLGALRQGLFLVAVLVAVRNPTHLLRLPFAEMAAVAVTGLCFALVARRRGYRLPSNPLASFDSAFLRGALPVGVSTFIWALRMYLPILVVLSTLNASSAGYFESAHRLFMVFQALLGVYFTNLFPAMSAATREPPEALIRLIRRAIHSVFWITAAGSVCMSFLAPLVIGLVYGERYATGDAVTTLVLLSWILPILVWRRTGRNSLIVLHHVRAELVCSVIGLTLLVVAVYPLTRLFGLAGAAAAMVFSEAVAALLTWTVLIVRLLERRRWDASSGGLREISSG